MSIAQPVSLLELNNRIARTIAATPAIQAVWVVAETSDLRVAGRHCYLELIEKDPDTGAQLARMRATIWDSTFRRLNAKFQAATGSPLASDIKIMVQVSVSYHPVYGLAGNIIDLNPEYTLGDLLRRRREMIARLEQQGILNLNRQIAWPKVPQRIAVVSARGAAGYGDFINQLFTNRYRLRFSATLFPAVMQGEQTAPSIIDALEKIRTADHAYDCVVIIRGGGATGDLASFDHYDLAAAIARFPIPVIVGIGHERDITLLDYVANMRVKTPTAAAEWLIGRGADALESLRRTAADILDAATQRIHNASRHIALIAGQIPELAHNVVARHRMLTGDAIQQTISHNIAAIIKLRTARLDAIAEIIDTLSPQATLRRGFSITRVDGHAITSPEQVKTGDNVVTQLADGILTTTKTTQN